MVAGAHHFAHQPDGAKRWSCGAPRNIAQQTEYDASRSGRCGADKRCVAHQSGEGAQLAAAEFRCSDGEGVAATRKEGNRAVRFLCECEFVFNLLFLVQLEQLSYIESELEALEREQESIDLKASALEKKLRGVMSGSGDSE